MWDSLMMEMAVTPMGVNLWTIVFSILLPMVSAMISFRYSRAAGLSMARRLRADVSEMTYVPTKLFPICGMTVLRMFGGQGWGVPARR